MRLLKEKDFKTFEQLCSLTQAATKKTMSSYLHTKYKKVTETKDYICAEGNIPIALVAHMDTVFSYRDNKEVYYDRQKNVIWSPDGLGADDRAGIFAIIQILKAGLRPHIILTTDEEKGALGAEKLAQTECPFADLRYIIQLDRRGAIDCVFYSCNNEQFVEHVESFGFAEAIGSFSDISVICPAWKIAGVNLSIGYRDEHSTSEILFVGHMLNTIDKVICMLTQKEIPSFEYIPFEFEYSNSYWYRNWIGGYKSNSDDKHCYVCGKEFLPEELIPVKDEKGINNYYCIDCVGAETVQWCSCCGDAYEVSDTNKSGLCEDCFYDIYYHR